MSDSVLSIIDPHARGCVCVRAHPTQLYGSADPHLTLVVCSSALVNVRVRVRIDRAFFFFVIIEKVVVRVCVCDVC